VRTVNFDPEPPKLPRVSTWQFAVHLRGQVRAVRIEREHAGDRAVDELLRGHGVHVVLLHERQDVREHLEVLVGFLRDCRDAVDHWLAEPHAPRQEITNRACAAFGVWSSCGSHPSGPKINPL